MFSCWNRNTIPRSCNVYLSHCADWVLSRCTAKKRTGTSLASVSQVPSPPSPMVFTATHNIVCVYCCSVNSHMLYIV